MYSFLWKSPDKHQIIKINFVFIIIENKYQSHQICRQIITYNDQLSKSLINK